MATAMPHQLRHLTLASLDMNQLILLLRCTGISLPILVILDTATARRAMVNLEDAVSALDAVGP